MEPSEIMADVWQGFLTGLFALVVLGSIFFSMGLAAGYFIAKDDQPSPATAAGPEPMP